MIRIIKVLMGSMILLIATITSSNAQDAEAGKQKSATCVACHGADGNSTLDQFPKIAGQVPGYIAKQLAAFKLGDAPGGRVNPVMAGMVAALSEQDMADLDAFYSSQAISTGSVSEEQEEAARAGETIFRSGIAEFSIPACMGCHGPTGAGIPPNFPRLAGQHVAYIESQLQAFKSGARANPIMQPIAFPLSDEQIKQLALYISALQ